MREFPRMLFRGEDTLVVSDAAQKSAAVADGWQTRWLPCDGPRPEPAEPLEPAEPKTKKGRAAKE
jgi:hypothetical protein